MAWHHHGSDTPTSAWAILHHTDQNGQNILKGSVPEQPDERRTASKSRGMEGRRHEKNACRLYSALAMTLKLIFILFVEKMSVNRKMYFNLKLK